MGYDVAVHYVTVQGPLFISIGDNAVTSSIRIAQVFPELVGKDSRYMEGLCLLTEFCIKNNKSDKIDPAPL